MAGTKNELVKVEPIEAELVESLPPEASLPTGLSPVEAEVKRLVDLRVAEILAGRECFQPYLQSRRLYQELRKLQSVPERRVWAVHYERHGCTHCRTNERPHGSCGMCRLCYPKISGQKRAIEKELSKEGER